MAIIRGDNNKNLRSGTPLADTIFGFGEADTLFGLGGNDTIDGGSGNDLLYGGDGNDTLIGGTENDWLDGGTGIDSLVGGAGNDTYVINTTADKITDVSGVDQLRSTVSLTLNTGIETAVLLGSANLILNGNTTANTLTGNSGNNILNGGLGNDTLIGGIGNDTLFGGATGADRFDGGTGVDTVSYVAETAGISIFLDNTQISSGNAFGDTFSGIENVIGSKFGDVISGTSLANAFTGGAGDDVLFGKGGLDTLLGGDGDDIFLPGADQAADIVNGGDGNDTVSYQDATQRVGISLESNLSDFGADNDIYISIENVIGTELNNDAIQVAFGGAAFGLGGTDTVEGSRTTGLDKQSTEFLTGGLGIDGFLLHLGTGADALLDFDGLSGGDNIFVFASEFTGINTSASFVLTTEGFVTASIASAQFIYERLTDTLYFDSDGIAGGSGPVLIAYLPDLGPSAVLTNNHFVLV